MSSNLDVAPEDLTRMAKLTLDGAEELATAWRQFLGRSVPPAGAFGSSSAGRELSAASIRTAHAADVAVAALTGVLQCDVDKLNSCARNYTDLDKHGESLIIRLRHALGDIF